MLNGSDSTLLEPVDVVGDVISVQSSVVMSHVIMILELVNNAVAEEFGTLIIGPIGVSIVPAEIGVKLFVVLGNELLGLTELEHALLVLGDRVGVLVKHSGKL